MGLPLPSRSGIWVATEDESSQLDMLAPIIEEGMTRLERVRRETVQRARAREAAEQQAEEERRTFARGSGALAQGIQPRPSPQRRETSVNHESPDPMDFSPPRMRRPARSFAELELEYQQRESMRLQREEQRRREEGHASYLESLTPEYRRFRQYSREHTMAALDELRREEGAQLRVSQITNTADPSFSNQMTEMGWARVDAAREIQQQQLDQGLSLAQRARRILRDDMYADYPMGVWSPSSQASSSQSPQSPPIHSPPPGLLTPPHDPRPRSSSPSSPPTLSSTSQPSPSPPPQPPQPPPSPRRLELLTNYHTLVQSYSGALFHHALALYIPRLLRSHPYLPSTDTLRTIGSHYYDRSPGRHALANSLLATFMRAWTPFSLSVPDAELDDRPFYREFRDLLLEPEMGPERAVWREVMEMHFGVDWFLVGGLEESLDSSSDEAGDGEEGEIEEEEEDEGEEGEEGDDELSDKDAENQVDEEYLDYLIGDRGFAFP